MESFGSAFAMRVQGDDPFAELLSDGGSSAQPPQLQPQQSGLCNWKTKTQKLGGSPPAAPPIATSPKTSGADPFASLNIAGVLDRKRTPTTAASSAAQSRGAAFGEAFFCAQRMGQPLAAAPQSRQSPPGTRRDPWTAR